MSKLTDVYGDRGSGKTILFAYFASKANMMNIPVIADYKLELPNYVPLQIDDILQLRVKYPIALVQFDEFDVYMNNRRSMSNLSLFLSNAIKQSRKTNFDIMGNTQLLDTIDWRFTELTNITVICYGIVEVKKKEYFRYDIVFKSIFGNRIRKLIIPLDFMEQLYDKYDTNEPVMPTDVKELALEVSDQKKLNSEVERVTQKILDNRLEFNIGEKRVTEKKLHDILLQLEEPESLAFYVSSRLNQKLGFD
jgi:hypothetical protein